jgi:IMP dehydrogenase
METGLSYSDVCLVPKYNNVPSRAVPTLDTWLTKNIKAVSPILAANMDSIIGPALAEVLTAKGIVPIFHRFYKDPMELVALVKTYEMRCFMSVGVADLEETFKLIDTNGLNPLGLVVDVAHGHSLTVLNAIDRIRKTYYNFEVIAGNVCTPVAFHDLVNAGATAVKVGIGPGSVCTTRKITAFGIPQFTAVQICGEVAKELKIPMIADGGIKGSREIILALAAGASTVMIGGLFAETKEAEGKGTYRGQASQSFQEDFYGGVKEGTVPEGVRKVVKVHISADAMIEDLLGGVRSGLTYGGSKNIKELQRKAKFMRVTPGYW